MSTFDSVDEHGNDCSKQKDSPTPLMSLVIQGKISSAVQLLDTEETLVNIVPRSWPGSQATLLPMACMHRSETSDHASSSSCSALKRFMEALLNKGMLSTTYVYPYVNPMGDIHYVPCRSSVNTSTALQLSFKNLLERIECMPDHGVEAIHLAKLLLQDDIHLHMTLKDVQSVHAGLLNRASTTSGTIELWELIEMFRSVLGSVPSLSRLCRLFLRRYLSTEYGEALQPLDLRELSRSLPVTCDLKTYIGVHLTGSGFVTI